LQEKVARPALFFLQLIADAKRRQQRMRRFVAWFDRLSPVFIRLRIVMGIAFGGFLVYGVS
jgi:hypothetical protein